MSYNFYSLVSSIKDKSSQAMATLSSDLKEFTSIVQEDVAEVASTVRKTVHEKSEALRQLTEQQQLQVIEKQTADEDGSDSLQDKGDDADDQSESQPRRGSLFSFGGLSLEAMGSKFLHSADEFLGSLASAGQAAETNEEGIGEDKLATARRYRLLALQEDDSTYLHPPLDIETFHKWRKVLSAEELKTIQEEVLAHYPTVATKLAELVPESVTADSFWAHYIYKASLLAAQEQRGADLLEHALNDSEEEVGWDVDSPRQGQDETYPAYDDDDSHPPTAEDESETPQISTPSQPVVSDGEASSGSVSPTPTSSDGESWIELDEQRRETQSQPPLSSSSTSSFVPVVAALDGPELQQQAASKVAEDEEEDVDWGDEDEEAPAEATVTTELSKKPGNGADWGEWD